MGAEILSAERFSLDKWEKGVPFATLFAANELQPGAPFVGCDSPATAFIDRTPAEIHGRYGLNIDEYMSTFWESYQRLSIQTMPHEISSLTVSASRQAEFPANLWKPVAESKLVKTNDGLVLITHPGKRDYALFYGPLRAPAAGTYSFRLLYRLAAGDILLGVLSADQSKWLGNVSFREGSYPEYCQHCTVHVQAGDSFYVVISKNNDRTHVSHALILSLQGIMAPALGRGNRVSVVDQIGSSSQLPLSGNQPQKDTTRR
jgi:hypothetical protein